MRNFDKVLNRSFRAPNLSLLLLLAFLVSCGGSSGTNRAANTTPSTTIPPLAFRTLASVFTNPVGLEMPDDRSNRFFVVEQGGTIKILHLDGSVATENFLDITSKVTSGGELGLL